MASRVEITFASLPTPETLKNVVHGADGVRHGGMLRIFVDLSTSGPPMEREVAAGLADTDIVMVDAPVSGGMRGALAGTLSVMMAGPAAACDKIEPIVGAFGKNVFRIGDTPGQGQTMKIANSLLASVASAATAEALVMGVKAGLDANLMIDVINASTGRNSASAEKFPAAVLTRTFDLGSATRIVLKDLRLYLEAADAINAPLWVGPAVVDMWEKSMAANGEESDNSTIVKYAENEGGVTVGSE